MMLLEPKLKKIPFIGQHVFDAVFSYRSMSLNVLRRYCSKATFLFFQQQGISIIKDDTGI